MRRPDEYLALRTQLGDDGMLELHGLLDLTGREWKEDAMETASDRFERRLNEESARIIRWAIGLWLAQVGVILGVANLLLNALKH